MSENYTLPTSVFFLYLSVKWLTLKLFLWSQIVVKSVRFDLSTQMKRERGRRKSSANFLNKFSNHTWLWLSVKIRQDSGRPPVLCWSLQLQSQVFGKESWIQLVTCASLVLLIIGNGWRVIIFYFSLFLLQLILILFSPCVHLSFSKHSTFDYLCSSYFHSRTNSDFFMSFPLLS